MSQPNPSTAMARTVVDELARGGVELFVISPGSRSAALAIAATEHPDTVTAVNLDERSAAFYALGRAKASGSPAVVIATSGTAPANYMPAVVEADMSLVPLILISADRPTELRGVGANQTIDQVDLFGGLVRLFSELGAPSDRTDLNDLWRSTTAAAVSAALGSVGNPGPVHLNIAFREPTVPMADDGRTVSVEYPYSIEGRELKRPWNSGAGPDEPADDDLPGEYHAHGVVIAGEGVYNRDRLINVAADLSWPILATAQSGLRGEDVVTSYHHLLVNGVPRFLLPEMVYAIGAIGPSARVEDLVASANTRVRVDRWGRLIDPNRNATHVLMADPIAALEALRPDMTRDPEWADAWLAADATVRSALSEVIESHPSSTGAAIAASLSETNWNTLVVASSLPIREIDAHLVRSGEVFANRGASGIDGFVSTALGVASARRGTVAVSGDLSLLHDSNGFLTDSGDNLVIVVVDNDGGGLFDELPPAQHSPSYERLFVAPQHRDLSKLSAFHDLDHVEVDQTSDLSSVVDTKLDAGGLSLIRVPVSRRDDLEMRTALDQAAETTLALLEF